MGCGIENFNGMICRLQQKGHKAKGIAHRVEYCSLEDTEGAKGLRVNMVD